MFVINIAGLLFLLAVNTLPGKMTYGYNTGCCNYSWLGGVRYEVVSCIELNRYTDINMNRYVDKKYYHLSKAMQHIFYDYFAI